MDFGTLLLTYYPRIRGGPFVEAGIGLTHYSLVWGTGDPIEPVSKTKAAVAVGSGWGYNFGVGWRFWRTEGWWGPRLAFARRTRSSWSWQSAWGRKPARPVRAISL
jgi:hypothetical protein